jgi:soluble cytochrome b562
MKAHQLLLPLLTLVLLASVAPVRADEDSPLEGQMKILARGTRQLSKQIADPAKQQENLALIATLRKATIDSKSLNPSTTAGIPEDKKASFLADYRTDLDELADAFDQLVEAVKASDYAKAQSMLGQLNTIKKEGHAKFKTD